MIGIDYPAALSIPFSISSILPLSLVNDESMLLLYRQGGRVANNVWTGSALGHFEDDRDKGRICTIPCVFVRAIYFCFSKRAKDKNYAVVLW